MILNTNQTLIRKPQTGNQTRATFTCSILSSHLKQIQPFKVWGGKNYESCCSHVQVSSFLLLLDCLFPLLSPTPLALNLKCPTYIQEEEDEKYKFVSKDLRICSYLILAMIIVQYSCCRTETLRLYISIFQSKFRPVPKCTCFDI